MSSGEIPTTKGMLIPNGIDQDQLNSMLKDAGNAFAEDDDLGIPPPPQIGSQRYQLDDVLMQGESSKNRQESINERPKMKDKESCDLIQSSLQNMDIDPSASLVKLISKYTKGAVLSSSEFEVMAMTIRACKDEFSMVDVKMLIDNITGKMKTLTSEVDDMTRKSRTILKALDDNNDKIVEQKRLLDNQPVRPSTLPTPPSVGYYERARMMMDGFINMQKPSAEQIIRMWAEFLEKENVHLSVETFKLYPQTRKQEMLAHVLGKYQ
ncbi:TPA_asm: P6 [Chrysanthemum trirhavirus 1]|nr:TPA_asm: P6 [Chrysanthemum trirhavirus 1]